MKQDSIRFFGRRSPCRGPLTPGLLILAAFVMQIGLVVPLVHAVKIQNIVNVKGLEQNELVGIGLVTGLNGTGDTTKKSRRITRLLFEVYRQFGVGVESIDELEGIDSVALVYISCTVPRTGVREGDLLRCRVSAIGDATNLAGGQLMWTILKSGPNPQPFAKASGLIEVSADNPRAGLVRGGVQMIRDIRTSPINPQDGTITLVIDDAYAGIPVAQAIANRITQEFEIDDSTPGEVRARAVDSKNVVLTLAPWQYQEAEALLAQILTLDIDASLLQIPARVAINQAAGTIVITGDVEISPVIINSRGLSITRITPPLAPTPENPLIETENHVALQTSSAAGAATDRARLQDLLSAMEALKVPFDDRVAILREMNEIGVLHGKLIEH